MPAPIKVLVVDDSALVRQLLTEVINTHPRLEVVAAAHDPFDAREKIKRHQPDVLTLDIEMPKMDGITFLSNLMRLRPMPVVMISTLTEKGADITLQALELGAVDYVAKPRDDVSRLEEYTQEITSKLLMASRAKIQGDDSLLTPEAKIPELKVTANPRTVIAIGASTGGPEALKNLICQLPAGMPPIVIAQHIPEAFSASLARRINLSTNALTVKQADDNEVLQRGHVYIAPGDDHLMLVKKGSAYYTKLSKAEPVNRHRPAVDVLFDSVAEAVGKRAIAVLLTGMGADGAQGLLTIKNTGAYTIAQDESSSVVWGMPGAAVKLDAAVDVTPLARIPQRLVAYMNNA